MSDLIKEVIDALETIEQRECEEETYSTIQCAIEDLEAEVARDRWISVDDERPVYGVLVLTWCEYSGYDVDYMKTSGRFTSDHPTDDGFPKTHWRHLTPPGGSGNPAAPRRQHRPRNLGRLSKNIDLLCIQVLRARIEIKRLRENQQGATK